MVKREEITRGMVEKAQAIYLDLAYGKKSTAQNHRSLNHPSGGDSAGEPVSKAGGTSDPNSGQEPPKGSEGSVNPSVVPSGDPSVDPFEAFVEETEKGKPEDRRQSRPRHRLRRHSLRLGNRNYPFMKLVIQEHLIEGEFYFTVDTHDQMMEIRPDYPDYEPWMRVKRFNLKLKSEIEAAFEAEGIPTLASLRNLTESLAGAKEGEVRRGLILVVDDEENEACMMAAILQKQGYEVIRAGDGLEALQQLRFMRPILIVLDYEMPEMDGVTMIRELRSHADTRGLLVLLTTANQLVTKESAKADGFLPKPFHSRDLVDLVEDMLSQDEAGGCKS